MKRLALILIPPLTFTACHHEQVYQKPLTPVTVQTVQEYTTAGGSRYSGNVFPNSQLTLAFKSGGYVEHILQVGGRNVQEGDEVKKGQVLARVRLSDYQAKVREAQSNLAQATAAVSQARFAVKEATAGVEKARLDLDRADHLFRAQSLTKPDLDAATAYRDATQARLDQAQSQVEFAESRARGAQAQLEEVEIALHDTELTSPLDALVMKRSIELGSLVIGGATGFILADTSAVKVIFGAPDVLLPRLRLGFPLTVTVEAINGAIYSGRVTSISPAADIKSHVFDVEISVPNPRGQLKPGMIAALEAPGERTRKVTPVVPLTSIVRSLHDPTGYGVFVIEKQGGQVLPRARDVVLGEAFGNLIAVEKGIRPGERVIVTGATLVRDGEPVQVMP